jgi:glyoxylase-like metal-dependent hydrolase (beta-lactamase superfamily II)
MSDSEFRTLSAHVDMFTPDERSDRPALGAVHGEHGMLLVEGGASTAHLVAFVAELERRGRPPVVGIVLTHWHWDHSFGSAAVDTPVIAHRLSAEALTRQAAFDWSDEALDARVAAGTELDFCREMMKLEMPDRSRLRIVLPSVVVDEHHAVELGGATAVIDHVGGDHAPDSLAVYVPEDRVIFLGDCLYQRLRAPVEHLTVAGVRALTDRLARYDVAIAVEGHNDDVADAGGFAARLAALRSAADLVERYGDAAVAHAVGDEDVEEAVGFLLAGERSE